MDMALDGGYADPVLDAQASFRGIMEALARPGSRQRLVAPGALPAPLTAELAAVMLTLVDHDTPIWLDRGLRSSEAVGQFVSFHTGARIVDEPGRAVFAFALAAANLPVFASFNTGTQDYPDRSTTIALAVSGFDGDYGLKLRGPGINGVASVSPVGLPVDFVRQWELNRELFPRGVDLLLVAGGTVMGLPRSTRIARS